MNWEGLNCVITGASSGFGLETARKFAAKGATVIACARREEKLKALVDELGEPHSYYVCDVSNLGDIRAVGERLEDQVGYVDVLVNNAGIPSSGTFAKTTSEEMEQVVKTNLLGSIWCTREWLPLLEGAPRTARTPVIVNVASMAGRIPVPRSADYVASKFGLVGFTESVWPELKEVGVRTMVVNPGTADTEGFPMEQVRANPLTAWTVMDASRVANAIIRGIERGGTEVRVQWWLYPLYYFTVAAGPFRRYIADIVRSQYRGV